MASSTAVLSQTLQSITVTKIKELEKQRVSYDKQKNEILSAADQKHSDEAKSTHALIDGLEKVPGLQFPSLAQDTIKARRWLNQHARDPSVPQAKLDKLDGQFRSHLCNGSRKLDLAHLYSRLLTEWIEAPTSQDEADPRGAEVESEGSFEILQDTQKERLDQLRDKFAAVVFTPLGTDEVAIDVYLSQLFEGDSGQQALKVLREEVSSLGNRMLKDKHRLDHQSLKWCIKALLKNELLNDEKKASLKDFLKDEDVLGEIRDVLNMRMRNLKTWDWDRDVGCPVLPRRSLNGKWRVMMDEDVLQALLTHWIGTCWAVSIKHSLTSVLSFPELWKIRSQLPEIDRARLKYFLMADDSALNIRENVQEERRLVYKDDFFLASLPNKLFEEAGGYDDDDDVPEVDPDKKSPKDVKQLLLRTLAAEVVLRRSLDGEVAVVQSDFQWFATGIAHSTIFAVMRFVGFPEDWIDFFKKALSPPMDMLDGGPIRARKRGLPMAHIFEKLLGELVLFFMDFAVAKNSEAILYRFHDDLWLAGRPEKVSSAWKTMEDFAKVMGLEFNKNKTGSVYLVDGRRKKDPSIVKSLPTGPVEMNFLTLDPDTGSWTINQKHVQQHVEQLQKQLSNVTSVLQWTKTWNSCIGRFFSYTFGEPAQCFGRAHLNETLKTHTDMQRFLFNDPDTGTTVTEYLKHMIRARFQVDDIPDSFLWMPESLGGLGLKNPFVPLLLLRDGLCEDPAKGMHDFLAVERENYDFSQKTFEEMTEKARRKQFHKVFVEKHDPDAATLITWEDAQTFMSYEEYGRHREAINNLLHEPYTSLLKPPEPECIELSAQLKQALAFLDYTPDGFDAENEDREILWTVQFLEDELFEKFGGLEVVDRRLLPMGVLKAMKARKVTWQMVL